MSLTSMRLASLSYALSAVTTDSCTDSDSFIISGRKSMLSSCIAGARLILIVQIICYCARIRRNITTPRGVYTYPKILTLQWKTTQIQLL